MIFALRRIERGTDKFVIVAFVIVTVVLGALLFPDLARAQGDDPNANSDVEYGEYCWAGICAGREQLNSGRVTLTGRNWDVDASGAELGTVAHYDVRAVFDYAAGKIMYDVRNEPPLAGVYVKTPEFQVMGNCQKGAVAGIYPLTKKPYSYLYYPDPRACGWISESSMGRPISFADARLLLRDRYSDFRAETLADSRVRLTAIRQSAESPEGELVLIADESRGYLVEEFRINSLPDHQPMFIIKSRWEQFQDVWLPVEVDFEDVKNGEGSHFEYAWSGINQPLPADTFDFQNLPLPDGQLIADYRIGSTPILVAKIGVPDFVTPTYFEDENRLLWDLTGRRALLLAVNVVVLVVLLALMVQKWRQSAL